MARFFFLVVLTLASIGQASDRADHECRVFLNHAMWIAQRGSFTIAVITPNRELFVAPTKVKVRLRFDRGNWEDVTATQVSVDNKFCHYTATYTPTGGGHRSMILEFIPFLEIGEAHRLFDHNWHNNDGGFITLQRSNRWMTYELAPHCFR